MLLLYGKWYTRDDLKRNERPTQPMFHTLTTRKIRELHSNTWISSNQHVEQTFPKNEFNMILAMFLKMGLLHISSFSISIFSFSLQQRMYSSLC